MSFPQWLAIGECVAAACLAAAGAAWLYEHLTTNVPRGTTDVVISQEENAKGGSESNGPDSKS